MSLLFGRAGERSRALLRGEEGAADEASMLFLVAQDGGRAMILAFSQSYFFLARPIEFRKQCSLQSSRGPESD